MRWRRADAPLRTVKRRQRVTPRSAPTRSSRGQSHRSSSSRCSLSRAAISSRRSGGSMPHAGRTPTTGRCDCSRRGSRHGAARCKQRGRISERRAVSIRVRRCSQDVDLRVHGAAGISYCLRLHSLMTWPRGVAVTRGNVRRRRDSGARPSRRASTRRGGRRFWRDSLRRRVLALADAMAVIVSAVVALGFRRIGRGRRCHRAVHPRLAARRKGAAACTTATTVRSAA